MAIGSGLAGQLGAAKETTYGTAVTVTKFFELNSENIAFERNRLYSQGIKAGKIFQSSARVMTVTRAGSGPVNLEVPTKGFGFWPDLLVGGTVTPAVVAGTAFKSTFNIGASDASKSATVQVGRPGTDGTVRPYTHKGCVVTSFSLNQELNGFLECEVGLDTQDRLTATALAAASYPSANESYNFSMCSPTVNSVAVTDVFESVKVDVNFQKKVDRWRLGSGGAKAQPITNDYTDATIEFAGDFKDNTFTTLYDADTIFPVVLTWTHTSNADVSGTKFSVTLTAQACQMQGDDPNLDGPDMLSQGMKLKVLDDGTNPPIKLEVVSTDSAAW